MIDLSQCEKVWYVSDANGDAGNGGTSWADAKKTVGQGLALMSDGHALLIGPGTYSEQIDASSLAGILIAGCGPSTILTNASGWTLKLGSAARVCDMTINATKASPTSGEFAAIELMTNDLIAPMFERIRVNSTDIGIRFGSGTPVANGLTDRFGLLDSDIAAAEYGVQIYGGRFSGGAMQAVIDRCNITCMGWTVCGAAAIAFNPNYVAGGGYGALHVRDSSLIAVLPADGAATAAAYGVLTENSARAVICRTAIRAENLKDGDAGNDAMGLHCNSAFAVVGDGTQIATAKTHADASAYDLYESGDGRIAVSGCWYDTTKTLGDVTDLDRLLSAANVDSTGTETISIPEALEALLAVAAGKATVAAGTVTFQKRDGATANVAVTHDALGNRSGSVIS